MKILVLVFTKITSAFVAESYQGDRTQGQEAIINCEQYTGRGMIAT
jgi:hypothetical protein